MTEAEQSVGRPDGDAAPALSALDAACLFLERPNQPLHLGCVVEIAGTLRLEELLELLSARLLLRRFRQRPARAPLDLTAPSWEDDPAFDLREHVRHVALPEPGDEEQLRHVVETLFSTPLPPHRPLWEVHLIGNLAGGRSALLCKVHHCMNDGLGALHVLHRIADPLRGGSGHDSRQERARPAPLLETASPAPLGAPAGSAEHDGGNAGEATGLLDTVVSALRALASPTAVLGRVRELGEAAAVIESLLEPREELPFVGQLGFARRMAWRSFPLDELASLRTAADCTINDAVLAVVSGCLRRHLEDRGVDPDSIELRAGVPVSVRGDRDEAPESANLFTAVFPRLPVDSGDPLERLRRIRDEMRDLKRRGQARATGLVLAMFGALPWAAEAALLRLVPDRRFVDTVCTNLAGPKQPLHLLGRQITDIHPIVPLFQRIGLAFAVASYAGRVSICVATDPGLVSDPEDVLNALEESLYETRSALWARSDALAIAAGLARRAAARNAERRWLPVADPAPGQHWEVQPLPESAAQRSATRRTTA
jgi:WS/DGAT/MGAT family acyltransferase